MNREIGRYMKIEVTKSALQRRVVELAPEVEVVVLLPEVEVEVGVLVRDRPHELAPHEAGRVVEVETFQPDLGSMQIGRRGRVL